MKIFLSALNKTATDYMISQGMRFKWNLLSYYQIRKDRKLADIVKAYSDEILIDSGAHSFQKGKHVDWVQYTKEYIEFIKAYDSPKVIGYFEMDADNIIGYDKVLQLRKMLEAECDKIIPVWHISRGIEEYKKMCRDYAGKIVAITGFKNAEIKDEQYIMFLKYAWKYGCKVHCLGMTRKKVLDKVPFDYTDSSSWLQEVVYGMVYNPATKKKERCTRDSSRLYREQCYLLNYKCGMDMQERYYQKWKNTHNEFNKKHNIK